MMHTLVRLAGVGALGVFAFCNLCVTAGEAAARTDAAAAAPASAKHGIQSQTVVLRVDGMTCGGCAIAARTVLRRLAGVEKADVSYERKLAIVTYDSRKVTPEQMIETLKVKLGYTARQVEDITS